MNKTDLEKDCAKATAEVAKWQSNVTTIRDKQASTRQLLDDAEKRRQACALGAATGDAAAVEAMKKVRRDVETAERDLKDLEIALPAAARQLAAAQEEERRAKLQLLKVEAAKLQRERVAAAAEMDEALDAYEAAAKKYEDLGGRLEAYFAESLAARGYGNLISATENLTGMQRRMAALTRAFRRYFYSTPIPEFQPLAASETNFWQLPLKDETGAAAA
jgi:chromosome segregation ATPase